MFSLSLSFESADNGGLIFRPVLTNTGDETIQFSTASSLLFNVHVETPEGEKIWIADGLATQAVEHWEISPGESISQDHTWEHPSAYSRIVELHDESLEEYCEKYSIEDWRDYEGETLIAVVASLGPENAPEGRFKFTVDENLLTTEEPYQRVNAQESAESHILED